MSTRRTHVVIVATATFFVVSLVLSVLGALVEEAWFEAGAASARVPGDMLVDTTLGPSLFLPVWFTLKAVFAVAVATLYVRDRRPDQHWTRTATFAAYCSLLVLATFGSLALVVQVPAVRWGFWAAFSCVVLGSGCAVMHVVLEYLEVRRSHVPTSPTRPG